MNLSTLAVVKGSYYGVKLSITLFLCVEYDMCSGVTIRSEPVWENLDKGDSTANTQKKIEKC